MDDQPGIDRKHEADLVKEIGMFSIKTMVTLCSGGFIVILTFLSGISTTSPVAVSVPQIKLALMSLLGGLVFCVITLFASFAISQARLGRDAPSKLDHSNWLLVIQAGPLLLAFVFFVVGVFIALTGMTAK
ncbi:hypothetical protein [Tritonibacter mobilis]|uniref:hypothetical protein n=1 Tax=Tritonibacter mobilis TaxID=379347 RepID=UPI000806D37D|nr:hypothetical protein [Tritonibacter mobilis]GLP87522.1 hypothetical protein GCM10007921_30820 [Tritonibacter mobilis]SDX55495.1 hypothetical protein SAMN05444385_10947 [Tritonibacter mobilis]